MTHRAGAGSHATSTAVQFDADGLDATARELERRDELAADATCRGADADPAGRKRTGGGATGATVAVDAAAAAVADWASSICGASSAAAIPNGAIDDQLSVVAEPPTGRDEQHRRAERRARGAARAARS